MGGFKPLAKPKREHPMSLGVFKSKEDNRGSHVQKRNWNWVNVLVVYCEPEAVCFHFSAEFQVLYGSTLIVD